jgi:hypothetical protein
MVRMERATRLLGAMPGGRPERQWWKKVLGLLGQVIEQTGVRPWRTAGERRAGHRWLELGRHALRQGKRGRPTQTRRTGVHGRRPPPGAHRPQRGPTRPTSPAP